MTTYTRATAGAAALTFARKLTGFPYVYGGTWPGSGGTDCDGLMQWSYAQVGCTVYRPTYTGYLYDAWDQRNGHADDPHEVGDLLWIPGADPQGAAPGHVMMYVAPGKVFQAEQTGTLIGEYDYDTTVWSYRTRPALQLAPAPPPPPVPGSPADVVGARFRPRGGLVLLRPGHSNPKAWVVYLRRLAREIGLWPWWWPIGCPGFQGFGSRTQNCVIRVKHHYNIAPDNAECGGQVWSALGVR